METFRILPEIDCEQSLRMVTRARKARARKSSEASESRGEAAEKAGKEGDCDDIRLHLFLYQSGPVDHSTINIVVTQI